MQLDPDEIRNNSADDFFNKEEGSAAVTPLTIFFAVLAAILVSWFLRSIYVEWKLKQALTVFNQQLVILNKQSKKNIQEMQLSAKVKTEALNQARAEKLKQQKLATYRIEQEKQALISAGINERSRKVEAWEAYYKPAKGCEPSKDNKDLMKCGNDHARAKKRFETLWAQNKLR